MADRARAREAERHYRESHRDELNARAIVYRAANPEKHRAATTRWNTNNVVRCRDNFRRWRNQERNRIGCALRGYLWQALKHRDSGRDWRSDCKLAGLIGCSKPALVAHIEAQFLPGMSWANYGRNGWELDHIKPCVSFDLTDPNQQAACFNFANLRPRWASENRTRRP
jgi:hypothetical protein